MVWNRTHHEVLDPESLPWLAYVGVDVRVLSRDETDGAVTAQVRVPPGYAYPEQWALGTAFDAFVLRGSLAIGKQPFEQFDYTYRPAGYPNGPVSSTEGALVLAMTYGQAALIPPDPDASANPKAIEHVRLRDVPARQPLTDKINMGYFSRTLRLDPDSGERIFVTGNERAGVGDARIEWHPVVEEIYKLGPRGSMDYPYNQIMLESGHYCYRPPGIPHGGFEAWQAAEFGSFIRVNATLVNYYVDEANARAMLKEYGRERLDPIVAARIDRPD
jgi:hypothetical protein